MSFDEYDESISDDYIDEFLYDTQEDESIFFTQPQSYEYVEEATNLLSLDRNLIEKISDHLSLFDLYRLLLVCKSLARTASLDFWYRRLMSCTSDQDKTRKYFLCILLNKLFPAIKQITPHLDVKQCVKICSERRFKINFFHPNDPIKVYINENVRRMCNITKYYLESKFSVCSSSHSDQMCCIARGKQFPPRTVLEEHTWRETLREDISEFIQKMEKRDYLMFEDFDLTDNAQKILEQYLFKYPAMFRLVSQ